MSEKPIIFDALFLHETPSAGLERLQRFWRSTAGVASPFNLLPPFMPVRPEAFPEKGPVPGLLRIGAPQLRADGYLICPLSLDSGCLPDELPLFPAFPPLPRAAALILGHSASKPAPAATEETAAFTARVAWLGRVTLKIETDSHSFYRCERSITELRWIKFSG